MAELVGEAFLSSLFQVTLEKLASRDFRNRFRKGNGLMKKLEITLSSISPMMDEAEKKQHQSTNVKKWLADLKHVAYEVDQLLEEIATDRPLKKLEAESKPDTCIKVLGLFSTFSNPYESKIKELAEKLEFLAKEMDMLGLKQVISVGNEAGVSWKPLKTFPTTPLVDESDLYGRDGDKEDIIKLLLSDNDSGSRVPIISLVGPGGAYLVFNDHRMRERFEAKAWVSTSESFCLVDQDKSFLRPFQSSTSGKAMNLLQQQLVKASVMLPFINGSSGSKVIVTTRDEEVASVMQSTQLLHLKQLEESDCWSLFVRHAFYGKNLSEYPNLESIGKRVAFSCENIGESFAKKILRI